MLASSEASVRPQIEELEVVFLIGETLREEHGPEG